jgi:hypothetical protein
MSMFIFPISLLGMPPGPEYRLTCICSWCVREMGSNKIRENEQQAEGIYAKATQKNPSQSPGEGCLKDEFAAFIIGRQLLKVNGDNDHMKRQATEAGDWISARARKDGNTSHAAISSELFWEQMDQSKGVKAASLSWPEFALLCAVNAAIGNRQDPAMTSHAWLRSAACGLRSCDGLFDAKGKATPKLAVALKGMAPDVEPLTVKQTRDALDHLERKELIGRIIVNSRRTAYYLPYKLPRRMALAWLANRKASPDSIAAMREEERAILQGVTK